MNTETRSGATHAGVCRLFLRGLGVVYLIAFASLWTQVHGLVGSDGVLPVARYLEWVSGRTGAERYWLLPTLCWLSASDGCLHLLCGGGAVLALLLIADVAPIVVLPLLWLFYLSLAVAGQIFLQFQWDALLLEAGLLAVFVAPWSLKPRPPPAEPSPVALWLLRWLFLRLYFMSGLVKLLSGDPAWRGLTALRYHYETQPLPTWAGWYAHQLPPAWQTLSCGLMFAIELLSPWLVFAPRRLRLWSLAPLVGLQLLIALTGNYGFFNLLTLVLCVPLLDDAALPRRLRPARGFDTAATGPRWPRALLVPVAVVIGVVSGTLVLVNAGLVRRPPGPVVVLYRAVAPLRSINTYGLFAVMTTDRAEIVIEGSDDGVAWRAYEFKWKPGDPRRTPAFVQPHMPRLDWQMWFAALGRCEQNPWVAQLMWKLRDGSPSVLGLLDANPFPERPPRFVRAVLYEYRFSDFDTRRREGTWWRRQPRGWYCAAATPDDR